MSEILKNQIDEEPDFSIGENDIRETLKSFVKGMNKDEMNRFIGIYKKYQDKG